MDKSSAKKAFIRLLPILIFIGSLDAVFGNTEVPTFRGKIIDQKTKELIPFATIQVLDFPGFGTVSNSQGEFIFRGKEDWPQELRVRISYLGYQNLEARIKADQENILAITENVRELREVVIRPSEYERDLMREVIARIPGNFPNQHERIYAVTTEQTFTKPDRQIPLYRATANVQADIFTYANRRNPINVEILDKQTELFPDYSTTMAGVTIIAGAYNLQRFDLIAQRSGPFQLSNLPYYDFAIRDTLQFDGRNYVAMEFVSEGEAKGMVYFNTDDFGVKKVEVELFDFNKGLYRSINGASYDKARVSFAISVEYLRYPDGLYRFQYAYYNTYFVYPNRSVFLENIFTLQEFEKGTTAIPITRQIQYNEPLVNYFEAVSAPKDSVVTSIAESDSVYAMLYQYDPKLAKRYFVASNLNSKLSIGSAYQIWDPFIAQLNEPFAYQQSMEGAERFVPLIGMDIGYKFNKRMRAYYGFVGSLQQQRYHRFEFGIESLYSLSKTGGFRMTLGAGLGRQRAGLRLNNAEFEENTKIRRQTFNTGEALVFARQRDFAFTPRITFSKATRKIASWNLMFEFPIALASDSGLFFHEANESFFRSRARAYVKSDVFSERGNNPLIRTMPVVRLSYSRR
jgi:hypothetical protein